MIVTQIRFYRQPESTIARNRNDASSGIPARQGHSVRLGSRAGTVISFGCGTTRASSPNRQTRHLPRPKDGRPRPQYGRGLLKLAKIQPSMPPRTYASRHRSSVRSLHRSVARPSIIPNGGRQTIGTTNHRNGCFQRQPRPGRVGVGCGVSGLVETVDETPVLRPVDHRPDTSCLETRARPATNT